MLLLFSHFFYKYQILVKFSDKNSTFETEEVFSDKTKIIFDKCFIDRYQFEKQQILDASLINDEMTCGSLKVAVGSIIGSYGTHMVFILRLVD